jgi:hypothetical protein
LIEAAVLARVSQELELAASQRAGEGN